MLFVLILLTVLYFVIGFGIVLAVLYFDPSYAADDYGSYFFMTLFWPFLLFLLGITGVVIFCSWALKTANQKGLERKQK